MSNIYRGPAIDASYQVSFHLAKRFQMRRFLKIGQSETIFSSETTGPIATKLWWNGPWMAPFQNCVR
jgi:hypothetical protein